MIFSEKYISQAFDESCRKVLFLLLDSNNAYGAAFFGLQQYFAVFYEAVGIFELSIRPADLIQLRFAVLVHMPVSGCHFRAEAAANALRFFVGDTDVFHSGYAIQDAGLYCGNRCHQEELVVPADALVDLDRKYIAALYFLNLAII